MYLQHQGRETGLSYSGPAWRAVTSPREWQLTYREHRRFEGNTSAVGTAYTPWWIVSMCAVIQAVSVNTRPASTLCYRPATRLGTNGSHPGVPSSHWLSVSCSTWVPS